LAHIPGKPGRRPYVSLHRNGKLYARTVHTLVAAVFPTSTPQDALREAEEIAQKLLAYPLDQKIPPSLESRLNRALIAAYDDQLPRARAGEKCGMAAGKKRSLDLCLFDEASPTAYRGIYTA
jgi:hypothetical protein